MLFAVRENIYRRIRYRCPIKRDADDNAQQSCWTGSEERESEEEVFYNSTIYVSNSQSYYVVCICSAHTSYIRNSYAVFPSDVMINAPIKQCVLFSGVSVGAEILQLHRVRRQKGKSRASTAVTHRWIQFQTNYRQYILYISYS